MRILTWNTNKATFCDRKLSAAKWKAFFEMSPDIAMLQEVNNVPSIVKDDYDVAHVKGRYFSGTEARYGTALLAKKPNWSIGSEVTWRSEHDWVNRIQETFPGWLLGRRILHKSGDHYEAVSVHARAVSVECDIDATPELCEIVESVDVSPVRLRHNSKLWFTEILWSLLRGAKIEERNWIVAGDFNSSTSYDKPKNKGNGEVIARLNALGLRDCVGEHHGESVLTWAKSRKTRSPIHQLDYAYVNAPMHVRLRDVAVGGNLPEERKWLSDHLPIVCEFR